MADIAAMTPEQAAAWDALSKRVATRAYKHLPIIELCGWNGSPSGWLPYFNWEGDRDIVVALIAFHSARNTADRERIRLKIKDLFYGGEEGFRQFQMNIQTGVKIL